MRNTYQRRRDRAGNSPRRRGCFHDGAFFRHQAAELPDAFRAQHKFHTRLQFVFAIPELQKDAQDGLNRRNQFFFRQKISERGGFSGQAAEPAAHKNFKAAMRRAISGNMTVPAAMPMTPIGS